ncbi:hypothetical protein F5X68DRAFT_215025 [Plectosphaerella plurivora]|uniref:4'-phosphopantetheinyl transferase domain-containing protein n=1 Tax=Plectosphaerella plurivora TaxID=936078 RepID=A0A9P8V3Y0_9PEZI|nr:hypothetical protein F5X68DRAFT_215025 [Plectosphaerella plurivora]
MTPKPFPFPLNVGTDICQISRIFRVLASPRGSRFVDRILTPSERSASVALRDGLLKPISLRPGELDSGSWTDLKNAEPQLWKKAQFMAGRFAVKEAVFKAHPFLHLGFHDVVIARVQAAAHAGGDGETAANGSGPPVAIVGGEDGQMAQVSISHDGDYSTAVCLGFDPRR